MTNHDDNNLATADLASAPPRTENPERFRPLAAAHVVDGKMEMLPHDEVSQLKSRWRSIQIKFVDEPRQSVWEADTLVASTIRRLAWANLEAQWGKGGYASTEELRVALRRYRSFFDRLLSA